MHYFLESLTLRFKGDASASPFSLRGRDCFQPPLLSQPPPGACRFRCAPVGASGRSHRSLLRHGADAPSGYALKSSPAAGVGGIARATSVAKWNPGEEFGLTCKTLCSIVYVIRIPLGTFMHKWERNNLTALPKPHVIGNFASPIFGKVNSPT